MVSDSDVKLDILFEVISPNGFQGIKNACMI